MALEDNRQGEVKYLADKQKNRSLKPPRQKHNHEKKLQVVAERPRVEPDRVAGSPKTVCLWMLLLNHPKSWTAACEGE